MISALIAMFFAFRVTSTDLLKALTVVERGGWTVGRRRVHAGHPSSRAPEFLADVAEYRPPIAVKTNTSLFLSGERGRNRTYNLLIKSQLLCQLSYAPFWVGPSGMEIFWRGSAKSRLIHCILTPLFKQAGCKQSASETGAARPAGCAIRSRSHIGSLSVFKSSA